MTATLETPINRAAVPQKGMSTIRRPRLLRIFLRAPAAEVEALVQRLFVLSALLITMAGLEAQTRETYDIATFVAPQGWKRESNDFAVSYVVANNKTGNWCRVTLYKSQASSGDPAADFASEWKAILGKKERIAPAPTPETVDREGWKQLSGAGKYRFDGKDALAVLITLSGFGAEVSVVVETNSNEYMAQSDAFVASLQLVRPALAQQPSAPASARAGNQGITVATTNFDDGWVAQPFADYVRVTKDQTTVLLHYGIEITDEMRSGNNLLPILWNQLIVPRYNVSNVREFVNEAYTYSRVYFYEAEAVDKATGKRSNLGFRVVNANGIASCIEIIAPSKAERERLFPAQERIEAMLNYNKFAVAQADLGGTWDESTSSALNMYNSVTGAYAGMSTTAASNSFVFNADGTYSSRHVGAFGMTGNTKVYDQKYSGRLTVSPWEITLTNRFDGKSETFWAQYQAVRGGRILHLTNKAATGIRYDLARTK